jgi:hypothetical protein
MHEPQQLNKTTIKFILYPWRRRDEGRKLPDLRPGVSNSVPVRRLGSFLRNDCFHLISPMGSRKLDVVGKFVLLVRYACFTK